MDWPTVSLLLGLLVPVTVALIKLLPLRRVDDGHCANGMMKTEVAVLKSKYESFGREVDQLRKEMEMLGQKLEIVRSTIVELIKRDGL